MKNEAGEVAALRAIASLPDLQRQLEQRHMTPGWIPRPKPPLWKEMRSEFVPAHWRYAEARAAMESAGRLVSTELAERRNFIMRNPVPGNEMATLRTLIGAYQSILPGEKARSHRHTPHALRVILESQGSYSIVDGDKHPMESGDIVLTPGWCWHGHGHDGDRPAYWFDGLDVPLTHLLEPMFYEDHPEQYEKVVRTTDTSPMRFRWADTLAALERAPADLDGYSGTTVALDAPSMPTISLKVHAWPAGWKGRPYRHTPNTLFVVMKGAGRSVIGGSTFDWRFGDVLAAPGWTSIEHLAHEESVVFSMSDEPLMRWAKYYRLQALTS